MLVPKKGKKKGEANERKLIINKESFILVPNCDEKPENRLGGAFNNPLQPKMFFLGVLTLVC